jgi:hypothetical protein
MVQTKMDVIKTINNWMKIFGKDVGEKYVQKIVSPGDQFSVFTLKDGMVAFKPFVIIENQNETILYPHDCIAVDVRPEVEEWIFDQPAHMWKYAEEYEDCHHGMTRLLVNRELLTWMTLKWQ